MSTSLFHRRLRWTDVARLLDIGFESETLPALVTCPLCQGHTLRVYEDEGVRGAWFNCTACGKSGDCLSFPASVWQLDIESTVDRLTQAGLIPEKLKQYAPAYVKRTATQQFWMNDLWSQASKSLPGWNSPSIARVIHALRINLDLPPDRWKAGMGTILGAAPRSIVETAFAPHQADSGGYPVCRGRGWKDVLVMPYHSSGDRISGFKFIGRHALPHDHVFASVRSKEVAIRKDAGLYAPHASLGHHAVVAYRDDVFVAKQQSKHFALSGRFLNLIGWIDDGKHATGKSCWQQLNGKRVVHWTHEIDAAVIRQAFFFDADISTVGPTNCTPEALLTYTRQLEPADLMKRIIRGARPWRYVLSDWIKDAHDGAIEVMSRRLNSLGIDTHEIAQSLPDRESGNKLHELTGPQRGNLGIRCVPFSNGKIHARPDGWHYETAARQGTSNKRVGRVTDFTFRVLEVHVYPDKEVYKADVTFQGRTYAVDLVGEENIPRQLLRANVGAVYAAPAWVHKLMSVATAFDKPVIVQCGEHV